MVLEHKVMWIEGMFLRPHHFQQQDRRAESMLTARIAALQPFFWGFSRIELDEKALAIGKVALTACEGAFPDGLPFAFPGDTALIEPLELDQTVTNQTVWLVAPALSEGARIGFELASDGPPLDARYAIKTREVANALDDGAGPELLKLGETNLRLQIGTRPPQGFEALPLVRVREVTPDRRVVLEEGFFPPVLSADVAADLYRSVAEIAGLFEVRAEHLAGRQSAVRGTSSTARDQFLLLQLCNGWGARLRQIRDMRRIHPSELHRDLVEAAAELATFTRPDTLRPPPLPAYDHDDLTTTFTPVLEELRRSLGFLGEQKAVPIELEFSRKYRIYHNRAIEGTLFEGARFILVARAAMLEDEFRQNLPRRVSIGSTAEIMDIIGAAERSVPLRPLNAFPPDISHQAGWTCF
ncbi:MAG: type VI secretion system baseplate subunit TssK, partial [Pseudomonadota bacterium]